MRVTKRRTFLLAALVAAVAIAATANPLSAAMINEIRMDQGGTDNQEYFELSGTPGESLAGLTYLVIGDGTGGSGVIESVSALAGAIPADGYFLGAETTWNTSVPAGFPGGTVDQSFGASGLNFENTDNTTHLLVSGFSGANGNDLDTNDDGVLDVTPWTSIVDSVAVLIDPTATSSEKYYSSTVVGPDGAFAPGHVYRVPNHTGNFLVGDFDGSPAFDDTPGTANIPEPASAALMLVAAIGIVGASRRKVR